MLAEQKFLLNEWNEQLTPKELEQREFQSRKEKIWNKERKKFNADNIERMFRDALISRGRDGMFGGSDPKTWAVNFVKFKKLPDPHHIGIIGKAWETPFKIVVNGLGARAEAGRDGLTVIPKGKEVKSFSSVTKCLLYVFYACGPEEISDKVAAKYPELAK